MDLKPETIFDPRTEEYHYPNLDSWLNRAKEEGERLGRGNAPPSDSKQHGNFELEFLRLLNTRAQQGREQIKNHLSDLERQLSDVQAGEDLKTRQQEADNITKEAQTELDQKSREINADLNIAAGSISESRYDWNEFRNKANLTRPVDYSRRRGAVWIILTCLIIEIILNAGLLLEVNPFGLIGSAIQMTLIGLVNVVLVAGFAGAMLRQSNHVSTQRKFFAWIALAVFFTLDIAFNILVGHFRDSMQAFTSTDSTFTTLGGDTLQRFIEQPIGFDSFQSLLLALLGFMFFVVATWKWYQRDDAYPEHGQRDRQLKNKYSEYKIQYKQGCNDLKKLADSYIEQLKDIRHKLEIRQSNHKVIVTRGNKLVSESLVRQKRIQECLDSVIGTYYEANRKNRTTPEPSVFSVPLLIDNKIFNEPLDFNPPELVSLSEFMQNMHQSILDIQILLDSHLKNLKTLDSILPSPPDTET